MPYSADELAYLAKKNAMPDMPEPENLFYWQAFYILRGSRVMGEAIPLSAVLDYAREMAGITCPVQKQRLVRMVFAMDNAEREYASKAQA